MFRNLVCMGCLSVLAIGCDGKPKEQEIQLVQIDPMGEAKGILKRYQSGSKPGSELTNIKGIVDKVRQADPAKADILEKGLTEIEKEPKTAKAKSTELLKKLGWS